MRRLQRWRDLPQERAGGLKAEWISTCLGWQTIMIYFILTNHFVTLQQGLAKKSRWSHCAFLSVKMQFSICSRHYFAQCLFHFFHPQSGITYVFGLIAEVLFKGPFHKNDLFQLCPLGKKTTNRQEYYLAIRKKKNRHFSTAIPDSSVSVLFFSLSADTNLHMGGWKYMFYAAWLHKSTKQSFLFICLSLTGKWRSEADATATWTSCLNTESIFPPLSRRSWIIRCWIKPPPPQPPPLDFLPGTHIVTQMNDFDSGRNTAKNINLLLYTEICLEEKKKQNIQMELKIVHSDLK